MHRSPSSRPIKNNARVRRTKIPRAAPSVLHTHFGLFHSTLEYVINIRRSSGRLEKIDNLANDIFPRQVRQSWINEKKKTIVYTRTRGSPHTSHATNGTGASIKKDRERERVTKAHTHSNLKSALYTRVRQTERKKNSDSCVIYAPHNTCNHTGAYLFPVYLCTRKKIHS